MSELPVCPICGLDYKSGKSITLPYKYCPTHDDSKWREKYSELTAERDALQAKLERAKEAFEKIPRCVDKLRNTWEIPDNAFATFGEIVGIAMDARKELEV